MNARTTRRAPAALTALIVFGFAVTGCGIRPTAVPVDAGPAPVRTDCQTGGGETASTAAGQDTVRDIYLVCDRELAAVHRSVPAAGDMLSAVLLDELRREPLTDEEKGGYTTAVGDNLRIAPVREGDPASAVRLNTPPERIGDPELAQLVCTYAAQQAGFPDDGGGTALLGGPGDDPLVAYRCDSGVLRDPRSVKGTPIS